MEITKELKELSTFLKINAKGKRKEAKKYEVDYIRGSCNGYAGAYELCAKWIDEILKRTETK